MNETPQKNRRPWPMHWVAIAIISFMAIYTFVNVTFRKEQDPHLPYEEAQERQSRFFEFDMNGWKWLEANPGAESPVAWDETRLIPVVTRPLEQRLDRDLPMDLVTAIPKRPDLIETVTDVSVVLAPDQSLTITILRALQSKEGIGMEAFYKEGRLIILVVSEDDEIQTASPEAFLLEKSDAWPMDPCSVSLYTEETVYEWNLP